MLKLFIKIFKDEQGGTLSITYSFSPNTLIVSSQMNTNFTDVVTAVNAIDADNISDDAVSAAKLNPDVVRSGYGLVQHTDGSLYVDVSDTDPGLEITDGGIRVKVDGTTIQRTSSGLSVISTVGDHGTLSGLTDDDHTQYLNTTRHDTDDHSSFDFATMGTGILPSTRISGLLGSWESKSYNTVYEATTDGFAIVYNPNGGSGSQRIYSDSSNPPTTIRSASGAGGSGISPVKKGHYWKAWRDGDYGQVVYWIPLAS
jgi:hypothetical protein